MDVSTWTELGKWAVGAIFGGGALGIILKAWVDKPLNRTSIRERELKMHQDQIEFTNKQLIIAQTARDECDLKRREAELRALDAEQRLRTKEAEHQMVVIQLKDEIAKIQKQLDQVQSELNMIKMRYPDGDTKPMIYAQ